MDDTPTKVEQLIAETKAETARWMDAKDGASEDNDIEGLKVALFIAMKALPKEFDRDDFAAVITMLINTYEADNEFPEIMCACIHALSKVAPERMRDRFLVMKDGERIMWTERFGNMMQGDTEEDLDSAVDKIKAMMEADKTTMN